MALKYLEFNKQFGGKISPDLLKQYQQSYNWKGNTFKNLTRTSIDIGVRDIPGLIKSNLAKGPGKLPSSPIAVQTFDKERFLLASDQPRFIWYGHSVLLFRMQGKNWLIDPMFGEDASPIGPVRTKRYSKNTLSIIDQLPPIEGVFYTHDHYDHLDVDSVIKLKSKVKCFYVALGLGRHLEHWGVEESKIQEFDWWDKTNLEGMEVHFVPSRHFGGRGPFDRAKSLWGGWVFLWDNFKLFWSGDGGYQSHFKDIQSKFQSFDLAFIECGQYNDLWHNIHMFPEESVQAVKDIQAAKAIPIHWAGFKLAPHPWRDPIERFVAAARKNQVEIGLPQIGEIFGMDQPLPNTAWYESY